MVEIISPGGQPRRTSRKPVYLQAAVDSGHAVEAVLLRHYNDAGLLLQIKDMVTAAVDNAIKQLGNPGPAVNGDPGAYEAGMFVAPARTAEQIKETVAAAQGHTTPLTPRQVDRAMRDIKTIKPTADPMEERHVPDSPPAVFEL